MCHTVSRLSIPVCWSQHFAHSELRDEDLPYVASIGSHVPNGEIRTNSASILPASDIHALSSAPAPCGPNRHKHHQNDPRLHNVLAFE